MFHHCGLYKTLDPHKGFTACTLLNRLNLVKFIFYDGKSIPLTKLIKKIILCS